MHLHEQVKKIGKFQGVIQIAPSLGLHRELQDERAHELLNNPQGPLSLAAGDLTYHNGPTIGAEARLHNVYLGSMNFDTVDFDAFSKALVENGYYLSPDGKDATNGHFNGSSTVAWPFAGLTVDDAQIETWVNGFIASIPGYTAHTMVSLIMPVGSTITMQGSSSCSSFCGYHSMTASGVYYQVICDSSCPGCNPGNPNDGRMMIQAHEYAEWRSDPQGTAWYNDASGMENADECAWQKIIWSPDGKWDVQPYWVNGKNCYVGPYTPTVTPPPPPPPVPVTASMRMGTQPVDTQVSLPMSTVTVRLLDSNGVLASFDNTTVVTAVLHDANTVYTSPSPAKAVNGVCTFPGITPHSLHTGLYYVFSAPGITGTTSATFNIVAAPTPPPTGKATLALTEANGTVRHFTEN